MSVNTYRLGLHLREYVHHRLASGVWVAPLERLLVLISEVYTKIRTLEAWEQGGDGGDTNAKWVAPTDFERQTDKYWVRWEDLIALQLMIVEHYPLLIYGSDGNLVHTDIRDQSYEKLPNTSDSISSLYLDSDDLSIYQPRIAREEGAILIRFRWYGRLPQNEELLYVERKTHHESWVNKKSIKERLIIQAKSGRSFMDDEWDSDRIVRELTSATKSLEGNKLASAVRLCTEIQAAIRKRKLRPMIRTTYKRVAFQFPSNNIVRFTLDSDLCLSDEASIPLPRGDFCHLPNTKLDSRSINLFPYAVMEIKLQGPPPPFVQSLLDSGLLIESSKFSKFLTGQAMFRDVPVLPYWSEYDELKELFHSKSALPQQQGSKKNNGSDDDSPLSPAIQVKTDTRSERGRFFFTKGTKTPTSSSGGTAGNTSTADASAVAADKVDIVITSPDTTKSLEVPGVRENGGGVRDASTVPASGGSQPQPPPPPPQQQQKRRRFGGGRVLAKTRVKVEPKTFFANERTFIQWLSMSLLLISFALAMYTLDEENSPEGVRKSVTENKSAFSLVIVGCCFAMYALGVYLYRRHLLVTLSPRGFDALVGPIMLVVGVLTAVIVSLVDRHNSRTSLSTKSSVAALIASSTGTSEASVSATVVSASVGMPVFPTQTPGFCERVQLEDVTSLTFMPSGLAMYGTANSSLPPALQVHLVSTSANDIVTFATSASLGSARVHTRFGLDALGGLSDVVMCANTAYVVANGDLSDPRRDASRLIAFDAVLNALHGEWTLSDSFDVGGLTLVPDQETGFTSMTQADCDNGRGTLLVSETTKAGHQQLVSYSLPVIGGSGASSVLTRKLTYNSRLLFGEDLSANEAMRRAAALHYDPFWKVLVILHNKLGVLRSWRLTDATLIGHVTLPGNSGLWEGMDIVHGPTYSNITLGLNTPAAVWKFVVNRGTYGEILDFAPCANAIQPRLV